VPTREANPAPGRAGAEGEEVTDDAERVSLMLNEYHLQFLRLFADRGVRFLVIGGQARFAHFGTPTRDLDLWVDLSPKNRQPLEQALVDWKAKYPIHTLMDILRPLALRPKVQIKFPDADAWFKRQDGEFAEILVQDGIDILTSIGDADFDFYYERAATKVIDGINIPFLGADDIDVISPRAEPRVAFGTG
jgi:hypothetical protein